MKNKDSDLVGFAPVASGEPTILILGSMPSEASLQKQQYYGHARNAFWPIVSAIFGAACGQTYSQRTQILIDHGIALWDVVQSCQRRGSLDSNIAKESIRCNNLTDFFKHHSRIRRVFFNGEMAETLYKRLILPTLPPDLAYLDYCRLPSTSPANASLNFEEKLQAWQVIKQHVVK